MRHGWRWRIPMKPVKSIRFISIWRLDTDWKELNRHQSFPYVGYALGKRAQEKDAKLLKEFMGLNIVRCSHYMQSEYFLKFKDGEGNAPESLTNTVFGEGGVVTTQKKEYKLTDGFLSIDEHLFDGDALVIEGHQIQRVALTDPQRKEYLAVEFDAPLAGIWSPPKKQAPFVCIEPWYGRCDSERFDGELKDRDWENALEAGGEFEASYKIIIE
mgnify:CR=1 FL=1